jgi:hypothetical protein
MNALNPEAPVSHRRGFSYVSTAVLMSCQGQYAFQNADKATPRGNIVGVAECEL